jgi:hypothetical protein
MRVLTPLAYINIYISEEGYEAAMDYPHKQYADLDVAIKFGYPLRKLYKGFYDGLCVTPEAEGRAYIEHVAQQSFNESILPKKTASVSRWSQDVYLVIFWWPVSAFMAIMRITRSPSFGMP